MHEQGACHVLITSVQLPPKDLERIGASPISQLSDGAKVSSMILVGSSRTLKDDKDHLKPWFIQFPEIPEHFRGVGDLFAALTLARFQHTSTKAHTSSTTETKLPAIARAAELAVASVQGVLALTMKSPTFTASLTSSDDSQDSCEKQEIQARVERMRQRELRIIAGRREIEDPVVRHQAVFLPLI